MYQNIDTTKIILTIAIIDNYKQEMKAVWDDERHCTSVSSHITFFPLNVDNFQCRDFV